MADALVRWADRRGPASSPEFADEPARPPALVLDWRRLAGLDSQPHTAPSHCASGARMTTPAVTIVMSWDGKTIGGTIDPGPDAVPFKTATLDSSTWTVHIEAERPDQAKPGAAVRYVIDGQLANL